MIALNATTAAHASPEVIEIVKAFTKAQRDFSIDAWQVQRDRTNPTSGEEAKTNRLEMDRNRKLVRDELAKLAKRINLELGGGQQG